MHTTRHPYTRWFITLLLNIALVFTGTSSTYSQRPGPDAILARFLEQRAHKPDRFSHYPGIAPAQTLALQMLSIWNTESVANTYHAGAYLDAIVDKVGRPHVSFLGRHAYRTAVGWQVEVMDENASLQTSLALDSAGRPAISYCPFNYNYWRCNGLKYAHYDGSVWQIETVDNGELVGDQNSLALDAADRPHISYTLYRFQGGGPQTNCRWPTG